MAPDLQSTATTPSADADPPALERDAPRPLAAMMEAMRRFPDDEACRGTIQAARWGPGAFRCRRCDETERWGLLRSRDLFQCHRCGHQSSVTAGTPLRNTKLPLRTWFVAAHVLDVVGPRYPATDLARLLGIWPDAARNMSDKIRGMLATSQGRSFFGLDAPPDRPAPRLSGPGREVGETSAEAPTARRQG